MVAEDLAAMSESTAKGMKKGREAFQKASQLTRISMQQLDHQEIAEDEGRLVAGRELFQGMWAGDLNGIGLVTTCDSTSTANMFVGLKKGMELLPRQSREFVTIEGIGNGHLLACYIEIGPDLGLIWA